MKLDLNKNIKNIKGNDIVFSKKDKEGKIIGEIKKKLSDILCEHLVEIQSKNSVKIFEICQQLTKDGFIEIDTTDLATLEEEVKGLKTLTVLAQGQILLEFIKAWK